VPSRTCRSVSTLTVCRMIKQQRARQAANDQQRGDEELCAQPEMGHFSSIVSTNGARQGLPFAAAFPE